MKIDLRAASFTPRKGSKKKKISATKGREKFHDTTLLIYDGWSVATWHRQQLNMQVFSYKGRGGGGRLGVRTPQATCSNLNQKKTKKNAWYSLLKNAKKWPQWHSKLLPQSQNHCNLFHYLFLKSSWLSHPVADSPASLIAECVGEWMWVCESMLQDSGTPSLPLPLSVSVWVPSRCLPESRSHWVLESSGPAHYGENCRCQSVRAGVELASGSPKVALTEQMSKN